MLNRSRPSISVKLLVSYAVLLLSLVAVTVVAWRTLDAVENSARRIASHYAPQVTRISDAQMAMFRLSLEARHAMLSKTPDELTQTLERIGTLRKQMLSNLGTFEQNLTTEGGRERFRKIREADARFWQLGGEVLAKVQAGEVDAAFAQLKADLVPARDTMVAAIAEQRQWQEKLIIDAVEQASAAAFRTKLVVLGLSLLTFGLALWVAYSLTRMISGAFARARAITERIAAGDLSAEIYVRPGDEFGYLFGSLANMQSSLAQVIGGVRRVAAQVTDAAQQIDHATDDLAGGTRAQSSALDGTAAATRRISENARGSASSIGSVSALAADASRVATEGGSVVAQVVHTMRDIDDSSRRISEIVNVIDGIAFQTNILALNAAVEAARAGEQGRGFAVVASEVRNLAQRSAAAAREVKALISESAARVQGGSALVHKAGETMSAIVSSVQQVTDLMSGLAASAREQSDGVAAVNAAMGEIDRAARTNAERVDRAQSVAAALREHAQALQSAVATFRIEAAPSGATRAQHAAPSGPVGAWAAA